MMPTPVSIIIIISLFFKLSSFFLLRHVNPQTVFLILDFLFVLNLSFNLEKQILPFTLPVNLLVVCLFVHVIKSRGSICEEQKELWNK